MRSSGGNPRCGCIVRHTLGSTLLKQGFPALLAVLNDVDICNRLLLKFPIGGTSNGYPTLFQYGNAGLPNILLRSVLCQASHPFEFLHFFSSSTTISRSSNWRFRRRFSRRRRSSSSTSSSVLCRPRLSSRLPSPSARYFFTQL